MGDEVYVFEYVSYTHDITYICIYTHIFVVYVFFVKKMGWQFELFT